jgi:hypothetical protein
MGELEQAARITGPRVISRVRHPRVNKRRLRGRVSELSHPEIEVSGTIESLENYKRTHETDAVGASCVISRLTYSYVRSCVPPGAIVCEAQFLSHCAPEILTYAEFRPNALCVLMMRCKSRVIPVEGESAESEG